MLKKMQKKVKWIICWYYSKVKNNSAQSIKKKLIFLLTLKNQFDILNEQLARKTCKVLLKNHFFKNLTNLIYIKGNQKKLCKKMYKSNVKKKLKKIKKCVDF